MNAGHFSQPTAKAMGQIVMWFTPFNKELERTPVKAIIQKLMRLIKNLQKQVGDLERQVTTDEVQNLKAQVGFMKKHNKPKK